MDSGLYQSKSILKSGLTVVVVPWRSCPWRRISSRVFQYRFFFFSSPPPSHTHTLFPRKCRGWFTGSPANGHKSVWLTITGMGRTYTGGGEKNKKQYAYQRGRIITHGWTLHNIMCIRLPIYVLRNWVSRCVSRIHTYYMPILRHISHRSRMKRLVKTGFYFYFQNLTFFFVYVHPHSTPRVRLIFEDT